MAPLCLSDRSRMLASLLDGPTPGPDLADKLLTTSEVVVDSFRTLADLI
jgi:hypothetical protein